MTDLTQTVTTALANIRPDFEGEITGKTSLQALDLDSLDIVELTFEIEEALDVDVEIQANDLDFGGDEATVKDIVTVIRRALADV